ncbi:MAG: hypothetical protein KF855_11875 [Acidobacteria bacterium]|nr:hypothetical protein [Acidobacteriota bacterium]
MLQPSLIQPKDFDDILNEAFKKTEQEKLKLRDVIRYATDEGKTPQHFTNFIFRTDEGTPMVFSKSGTEGRYEIGTAADFETTTYGKISGYYTRR